MEVEEGTGQFRDVQIRILVLAGELGAGGVFHRRCIAPGKPLRHDAFGLLDILSERGDCLVRQVVRQPLQRGGLDGVPHLYDVPDMLRRVVEVLGAGQQVQGLGGAVQGEVLHVGALAQDGLDEAHALQLHHGEVHGGLGDLGLRGHLALRGELVAGLQLSADDHPGDALHEHLAHGRGLYDADIDAHADTSLFSLLTLL